MTIEDRIQELEEQFVSDYNKLKEYTTEQTLTQVSYMFLEISLYDVQRHIYQLGRELTENELRLIKAERCYERLHDFYKWARQEGDKGQYAIPVSGVDILTFLSDWYKTHKLWLENE